MTISKLIRELQKIQKQVGPRTEVVIGLEEFRLVFQEYSHWGLHGLKTEWVRWEKEGSFELADGSERMKLVISIN